MKTSKLTILFVAAAAVAFTGAAQAQTYDFTFSGAQSAANGEVTVTDNIATSGFLDVTAGANQGTYNLISLNSPLINGNVGGGLSTLRISGNDQVFDDVVNAGSDPFVTNVGGIEFANGDPSNPTGAPSTIGFNLFSNGPGSYTLYDVDDVYITDSGTASITPLAAPEPSTWALGLIAAGFIVALRRRLLRA